MITRLTKGSFDREPKINYTIAPDEFVRTKRASMSSYRGARDAANIKSNPRPRMNGELNNRGGMIVGRTYSYVLGKGKLPPQTQIGKRKATLSLLENIKRIN